MDQALRDQIEGAIRILVPFMLAMAVSFGWVSKDVVGELAKNVIAGLIGLVTVGSVFWSIWVNRKVKQIESVANFPDVKAVITSSQIANVDLKDNTKVVTNGTVR